MSYAIDYEDMKNLFTAGYGSIPPAGWTLEGMHSFVETRYLEYDVNKSKALPDSIGMVDKYGDGFREMSDGKKFQAVITICNVDASDARAGEMLKKYFNDVGIDVKFKLIDGGTFNSMTGDTEEIILSPVSSYGINMGAGYGTSQ